MGGLSFNSSDSSVQLKSVEVNSAQSIQSNDLWLVSELCSLKTLLGGTRAALSPAPGHTESVVQRSLNRVWQTGSPRKLV